MRRAGWTRRRRVVTAVAAVVIVGFVVLAVGIIWSAVSAGDREIQAEFGSDGDDLLEISVTINELDPTERVLSFRLLALPEGRYAGPDGLTPAEDLRLVVATSSDVQTVDLLAGREPTAIDVPGGFTGQRIASYPFDRAVGDFAVWAVEADGTPVPVAAEIDDDARFGYGVTVRPHSELGDLPDTVAIQFTVERSFAIRLWVVFALVLMVGVAVTGLVAAILVALGRVRLDQNIFAFYAALLFAFPILRDSLPGAPSPGVVPDFVAFFPAEAMAAVGLLTVLGALIFGPQQRTPASPGSG